MKNRIIRYIIIMITCILISILIRKGLIYYFFKSEEKQRITKIKEVDINGIIEGDIYNGIDEGYDYYISSNTFIFGKYFFKDNIIKNLGIGDSVSKIKGELVLEIYRKDSNGEYQYIGKSQ